MEGQWPLVKYDALGESPGLRRRIASTAALLRGRKLVGRALVAPGEKEVRLSEVILQLNVSQVSLLAEQGEDAAYIRDFLCSSGHLHPYVLGLLAVRALGEEEPGVYTRAFYAMLRRSMAEGMSILEGLNNPAFVACATAVARGDPGDEGRAPDSEPWLTLRQLGPDASRLAYHAARFSGRVAHAIAIGASAAAVGHTHILCEHYDMPEVERPTINEVLGAIRDIGGEEAWLDIALPYILYA